MISIFRVNYVLDTALKEVGLSKALHTQLLLK